MTNGAFFLSRLYHRIKHVAQIYYKKVVTPIEARLHTNTHSNRESVLTSDASKQVKNRQVRRKTRAAAELEEAVLIPEGHFELEENSLASKFTRALANFIIQSGTLRMFD